ncbi:RluA family pseudouridine synthase [Thermoanaerobacterium thermosaccharolyticum]|jgi:23S rRNA pseudouridine1911/1915/1917 synthase|uniref:Pseudouridine synthase n=2 Tax=Thermoanaerobacterium thermosaccharolyticum TaxID=1517 RepID=D9TPS9_THETC|nr:RluA family pseudouridine synthase [Thermoanaerobacterium thermosaccharolyticum]ADL68761.1 pseudouridine synthase, RluA family [Thermoanaerobacterium thermosaccharolyticum DSM 571]AST59203.1 pseudouridine synthase [Thermoanaerobacterium thermosaccharolyticum]TCW37319.1 23S rRNA pseudouridine1911/1915/1917 synthase [Thermohydrogenium kirishiense]
MNIADRINIIAEKDDVDKRIDSFLASELDYTRSYLKKLILDGLVKVNGLLIKPNYKLKEGDSVDVNIPEAEEIDLSPENIPLDIIYEDDDIIVINKPQGMVVHPAPGNYSGTLVNALLYHCKNLSGINGELRPGIVHRLDKDTSGVMVVAKNDKAHLDLSNQIKERTILKKYIAIVEGVIKDDEGSIEAPIGRDHVERKKMAVTEDGRYALTLYKVLERYKNNSLIEATIKTGRTHQIRVHMSYIGHPIVGDEVYGYKKQRFNLLGQALHSKLLGLVHPSKKIYMEFEAPIPEYFERLINILKSKQ